MIIERECTRSYWPQKKACNCYNTSVSNLKLFEKKLATLLTVINTKLLDLLTGKNVSRIKPKSHKKFNRVQTYTRFSFPVGTKQYDSFLKPQIDDEKMATYSSCNEILMR